MHDRLGREHGERRDGERTAKARRVHGIANFANRSALEVLAQFVS